MKWQQYKITIKLMITIASLKLIQQFSTTNEPWLEKSLHKNNMLFNHKYLRGNKFLIQRFQCNPDLLQHNFNGTIPSNQSLFPSWAPISCK